MELYHYVGTQKNEVKPECENQIGKEVKLFLDNNNKKAKPDSPEEMAKRILNNIK